MIQHTVLNNKKEIFSDWLQDSVINLTDSSFQIPDEYAYEILEVTEKYIARPDLRRCNTQDPYYLATHPFL